MSQLKPLRDRPTSFSLVLALPQTLERNSLDLSKLVRGTLDAIRKVCALESLGGLANLHSIPSTLLSAHLHYGNEKWEIFSLSFKTTFC